MDGEIEVIYGKETYLVSKGDSIYYDSVVPHELHAHDVEAKILAVIYTPYFQTHQQMGSKYFKQ